jgi:arsenate reductase
MAEAFLQEMDKSLEVYSAGLNPEENADPLAIEVMKEIGYDISTKKPRSWRLFEGQLMDYLITICDGTTDKMMSVNIPARHKIHLGFDDPRKANCSGEQIVDIYRDIRDEIKNELGYFYHRILMHDMAH